MAKKLLHYYNEYLRFCWNSSIKALQLTNVENFAQFHVYRFECKVNDKVCQTCANEKNVYEKVYQKMGPNNLSLLILRCTLSFFQHQYEMLLKPLAMFPFKTWKDRVNFVNLFCFLIWPFLETWICIIDGTQGGSFLAKMFHWVDSAMVNGVLNTIEAFRGISWQFFFLERY